MRRLGAFLVLAIGACTPGNVSQAPSTPTAGTSPAATVPPDALEITVQEVIDGDSMRATAGDTTIEIRLLGINAPERDECWADEARAALGKALDTGGVSMAATGEDQYGRLLAYVTADGDAVNRRLIIEGAAIAVAVDHDQLPDFLAAEEEAIALGRGLWSPVACGSDGAGRDVRIWAIEPDAPGRDDRNPNGEFVALTTEGPAVELTGWMLRDESSAHRYTFPDGFVLDTGEIITVRSGCGEDAPPDLYWCADGPVWTNSGDTVLLLDRFGAVIDRDRYLDD